MGHVIKAYLGLADPDDPSDKLENWAQIPMLTVAFFERGAYSPLRHTLYEVLDAQECDGDVSGVYAQRWFSREQLDMAQTCLRQRLADGMEVQAEMDFVQACLSELPSNRKYLCISFE